MQDYRTQQENAKKWGKTDETPTQAKKMNSTVGRLRHANITHTFTRYHRMIHSFHVNKGHFHQIPRALTSQKQ